MEIKTRYENIDDSELFILIVESERFERTGIIPDNLFKYTIAIKEELNMGCALCQYATYVVGELRREATLRYFKEFL